MDINNFLNYCFVGLSNEKISSKLDDPKAAH